MVVFYLKIFWKPTALFSQTKTALCYEAPFFMFIPTTKCGGFYDVLLAGVIAGHGAVNGIFCLNHVEFGLQNGKLGGFFCIGRRQPFAQFRHACVIAVAIILRDALVVIVRLLHVAQVALCLSKCVVVGIYVI